MSPDVPTLEEILADVEVPEGGLDATDGFTYEEIQKITGHPPAKTRRMVKAAIERGKLTAHRSVRTCVTRPGYNVSCTVFRIKK